MSGKKSNLVYVLLLLAGVASMLATKISDEQYVCGAATFVSLILFLCLVTVSDSWKRMILSWLAFCAAYACKGFGTTGMPILDIGVFAVAGTLLYCLFVIYVKLTSKFKYVILTLVFPTLWLAALAGLTKLKMPILMRIDIYFFDMRAIIQCEKLITSYGLTFIILWVIALVAFAICYKRVRALVIALVVLAVTAGFGIVRMSEESEPAANVKVAYTTGPYVGDFLNYTSLNYGDAVGSLTRSVKAAADEGTEIIAFNEEAFEVVENNYDRFMEVAKELAKDNEIHILLGLDVKRNGDEKSLNRLVWISNEGQVLAEYDKCKTIPVLEDEYESGKGVIPNLTIDAGGQRVKVAFAICYDSNFAHYLRQIDDDTDIMFLPSWDWVSVTDIHSRICGSVAVENGVTVIKPTYDGRSVAIDKYGNIIKASKTDMTGFESVQFVDIPIEGSED